MTRLLLIAALLGAFFGVGTAGHTFAASAASDAAHACQQGGYANLMGSDGTTFTNAGQCTSYVAQGGTIVGIPACSVVTGTSGCATLDQLTMSAWGGNSAVSGTITLSGVYSFSPTTAQYGLLGFTDCGPAVGGGTYTVTGGTFNGGTSGTFTTTETVQTGFYTLPCTSGGSLDPLNQVVVSATFTDATSHATTTAYIFTEELEFGLYETSLEPLYGATPSSYISGSYTLTC